MRDPHDVFHLAIPTHDLAEARRFYTDGLGCRLAREYDDRLTLDFFGDQLVCHLYPEGVDHEPRLYPRHFGVTFRDDARFEVLLVRAREAGLRFFAEPFVRFEGLPEEHRTFLLVDPSNNLLEFKHYRDPAMMH
jgi:extradiol dioxygenase family protein